MCRLDGEPATSPVFQHRRIARLGPRQVVRKKKVRYGKAVRRHLKTMEELEDAAKEYHWLHACRSDDGQGGFSCLFPPPS